MLFDGGKVWLRLFPEQYVSLSLHLSKDIDSNQLCYIYLASYPSPVDLFPRTLYLALLVLPFMLCANVLYET